MPSPVGSQPQSPASAGSNPADAEDITVDPNLSDETDSAAGDEVAESTASLTDSIFDYRKIHGRKFQSSRTTEYWAPIDEQQVQGLDITHHFMTILFDDQLYLAPIGDHPQRVLDVGTGTGIWAIDFADQFPSAEVIGLDISPIQPEWVPPNLQFQIDDAQLPWTFPRNHFDFIHIRNLHGGISDWPALYRECFRASRPGGYIEDVEFNIRTLSDLVEPDHIYHQWNALFAEAGERMGRTFQIYDQMHRHIADAGYTEVTAKTWKVPIGGWAADQKLKTVGMYTLYYLDQSLEGFALYMLKNIMGWEYEEIQVLVAKMRQGLKQWKKWQPYYEIRLVYGRKPE
ncbi:S-adenosyl-L-methionine-dependent methyltransferase [Echria macrotheca]|uniref:S-adenosyl-L-methionine-dependent methyltransferase n=1 Tax=Echria macrotheca TaxID=438768 RepID=A0AAJ0B3G2_9PEZI|nr:S-adenosyl-L-methionine-dependent methyltransferase [Echria macrotheca]